MGLVHQREPVDVADDGGLVPAAKNNIRLIVWQVLVLRETQMETEHAFAYFTIIFQEFYVINVIVICIRIFIAHGA